MTGANPASGGSAGTSRPKARTRNRPIAAGSIIMMLPVLLVFLAAQRLFLRGMEGAVK